MSASEEDKIANNSSLKDIEPIKESVFQNNPIPAAPVRAKESDPSEDLEGLKKSSPLTALTDLESDTNQIKKQVASDHQTSSLAAGLKTNIASSNRDLTIQSLVHLMGMPTAVQVNVLDTKLDLISAKLGTIQSKIERMQSQLDLAIVQSPFERLEYQLTEVRNIMKKFFPTAFNPASNGGSSSQPAQAKPQVLSSKANTLNPVKKEPEASEEVKNVETKVYVEDEFEEEPLTDADYQTLEAMKMRDALKK